MFWAWIFVLLRLVSFLIWMWCTIHDTSMLRVVSVVTMMVISIDIGVQNNRITIDVEVTTNVKLAHHVIFYNFAKH
jgi:hypothetical protein